MADQLNWLERVKKKAEYNYKKRLRDQEEEKRFKESLDNPGATFEEPALGQTSEPETEKKGKK